MTIFIDSDYRCHISPGEGLSAIETDFFCGKCRAYIEGFRYIPKGRSWTRPDGVVFTGEMIAPAQDYDTLAMAQATYDEAMAQTADMQAALTVLGVTDT